MALRTIDKEKFAKRTPLNKKSSDDVPESIEEILDRHEDQIELDTDQYRIPVWVSWIQIAFRFVVSLFTNKQQTYPEDNLP